jgi:hypothetical protein
MEVNVTYVQFLRNFLAKKARRRASATHGGKAKIFSYDFFGHSTQNNWLEALPLAPHCKVKRRFKLSYNKEINGSGSEAKRSEWRIKRRFLEYCSQ